MKRILFCSLFFFFSVHLFGCSQEKPGEGTILARIDGYHLTLDEFRSQLAAELELDKDFKLTREARRQFLERMIKKELLIQQAKELKLDRRKEFVLTIERYWEATLIRDLLEIKGEEIKENTIVPQEEIDARYEEMKKSEDKLPPIGELQEKIIEELKGEKKTKALEEWINDLRQKANVQINQELL